MEFFHQARKLLLILLPMQMSKVSYVVAFRQVGGPLCRCDGNFLFERELLENPFIRSPDPYIGFDSDRFC